MKPSPDGYDLLKKFEGCRLWAYADPVGIPTIGYGHTHGVTLGMKCTQEQADQWLEVDASLAEACINVNCNVQLTQNQFDALVSFVYNVGCKAFCDSTLLKLLNHNDTAGAAQEFMKWDHAGGVVLLGLHIRRLAEQFLFSRA